MGDRQAVLIAGPTASGKSVLALETAEALGGVIVNADSMQVYDVLDILTARPSAVDLAAAEHLLYGVVPPSVRFSTGMWAEEAAKLISRADLADRALVFVGGTGLYFNALTKGIADIPPVPAAVVARIDDAVSGLDRAGRAALLAERDPKMAALLKAPDRQRVVRALSVLEATGTSLADWQQAQPGKGLLAGFAVERKVVDPGRDAVRARIAQRFAAMMQSGAVEEVRRLLGLRLDPSLPAMKAIGVPEIAAYLGGQLSKQEATERAITASHQYAKRQRTWLRKHMADWDWV